MKKTYKVRTRRSGLMVLTDVVSPYGVPASYISKIKQFEKCISQVKRSKKSDPSGLKRGMYLITSAGAKRAVQYIRNRQGENNFRMSGEVIGMSESIARSGKVDPFFFDGKPMRSVIIDGNIMFVAKDVAEMLGYKDTKKAIKAHCKYAELFKGGESHPLTNSPYGIKVIPEPDVWRLIVRSKLPEAQKIEEWLFNEVLPSLRKNGGYISSGATTEQLDSLQTEIVQLKKDNRLALLENQAKTREIQIQVKRGDIAIREMVDVISFNSGKKRTCKYCGQEIMLGDRAVGKKVGPKNIRSICHESCFPKYVEKRISQSIRGEVI